MNIKTKYQIASALWLSWGGLGAYRGNQYYNNKFKKDMEYYNNNKKYNNEPKYYFVSKIGYMINHFFIYIVPPIFVIKMLDEIYNLEDFIRNRDIDN